MDDKKKRCVCSGCGRPLPFDERQIRECLADEIARRYLARRDMAGVFKVLRRYGVPQRRIAALTGQSQSEISEILGGRRVVSVEVIGRIVDGLGVPRGWIGLAHDEDTEQRFIDPPES